MQEREDADGRIARLGDLLPAGCAQWAGLVTLALAAAVIAGHVHVVLPATQDAPYRPFSGSHGANIFDEATAYAPRAREVLDGHTLSGSPHSAEGKDTPWSAVPHLVASLVMGALAWLLGGSVPRAFIAADWIFPPLAVVVAYMLARRLAASHAAALCGASLAVMCKPIVYLPRLLARSPAAAVEHMLTGAEVTLSRTPIPQLSEPLMFAAVIAFAFVLLERNRRWVPAAVVLGGLAFYTYAYSGPFLLVGLAATAAWMTLADEEVPWPAWPTLGIIALLAVPWLISSQMTMSALSDDTLFRWGMGRDQGPWRVHWYRAAVTLLIALVYPRRRREYPLVVAFAVAPLLCIAAGRLSGRAMKEWHWHARDWTPWVLLVLPLAVEARWPDARRWLRSALIALTVIAVVCGAARQVNVWRGDREQYAFAPEQREVLSRLQENAAPDSVVVACDPQVLAMIPVYTHCNVYSPYSMLSARTDGELARRAGRAFYFCGLSEDAMLEQFDVPPDSPTSAYHKWFLYGDLRPGAEGWVLAQEDRAAMLQGFEAAARASGPRDLPAVKISWLVAPAEHVKPRRLGMWEPTWRGRHYAIYRAVP